MKEIFPDERVLVWDHRLWSNDKKTPNCYFPATVIRRYGMKEYDKESGESFIYPDLVDVTFDHRPSEVSFSHFTSGVEILK